MAVFRLIPSFLTCGFAVKIPMCEVTNTPTQSISAMAPQDLHALPAKE